MKLLSCGGWRERSPPPHCSLSLTWLSCWTCWACRPGDFLTGISGLSSKGRMHICAACGYLRSHASVTQLMGALASPEVMCGGARGHASANRTCSSLGWVLSTSLCFFRLTLRRKCRQHFGINVHLLENTPNSPQLYNVRRAVVIK